jgi:hypothetical protein
MFDIINAIIPSINREFFLDLDRVLPEFPEPVAFALLEKSIQTLCHFANLLLVLYVRALLIKTSSEYDRETRDKYHQSFNAYKLGTLLLD